MSPVEHLLRRRSVPARSLSAPGPDARQLDEILRAGIRVPDHGKLGPWRILVVESSAQAALGAVVADAFAARTPEATEAQLATEAARAGCSPLLLIVSTRLVLDSRIPVIEQMMSGGAVCQNLLTAAHGHGFAAQWVTGWPAYDDAVKAALGVAPHDHVIGWIHIGTATVDPTERQRPDVSDVVTWWRPPDDPQRPGT